MEWKKEGESEERVGKQTKKLDGLWGDDLHVYFSPLLVQ